MATAKVTVGLVLFGTKYLRESLPSLVNQDYPHVEFIFRDQEEGKWSAYEFIRNEMPEIFAKATVTKGDNLWHSGGHNAIIRQMKGEYYLCCSNDMLYPPDFVSKMVTAMEKNPEFGFGTCKIRQWQDKNKIDSCGIGITEYHHFYDIGQGEKDHGQYDKQKVIFGASGACCIFRKEALESIRYQKEYFDELMHYKNDVDLSYRLQWAGQKCLFIPEVVVYHDRQVTRHNQKSLFTKKSSFLGEKILMEKNYSSKFPHKIKLKTHIYHFIKNLFLLITTPALISELHKISKLQSKIKSKKAAIKEKMDSQKIVKLMT